MTLKVKSDKAAAKKALDMDKPSALPPDSAPFLESEESSYLLQEANPPFSSPITSLKGSPSITELVADCIPERFVDISRRVAKNSNDAIRKYLNLHELPGHLKDNIYILSGYRAHYTARQCIFSIFAIHNETGNIWTHLIGAIVFIVCLIVGYQSIPEHASTQDYVMVTIFLCSAIKCLLCSTIFHTFSCHSHLLVYDTVAILDYSGISLLILGSFVIYLNYALYCYDTLRWTYIAVVSFLCLSGVVLPWFSFFRSHEFRVYRTLFFIGMGLVAGLISIHTIFLNGWTKWSDLVPIEYLLLEIFLYLAGAYVYVVRIPEAWFPGKLDHWFHSHQVWHVMVFLAAYSHYIASIRFMESRLRSDTCAILG